jgi:hypothetical protein
VGQSVQDFTGRPTVLISAQILGKKCLGLDFLDAFAMGGTIS